MKNQVQALQLSSGRDYLLQSYILMFINIGHESKQSKLKSIIHKFSEEEIIITLVFSS